MAELVQQNPTLYEGTVVITDMQTAGRGQKGNVWEAEPYQNLTFSLLLKPIFLPIQKQFFLNMCVALGIYDFLQAVAPEHSWAIKWSNDILHQEKKQKIAGILIENTIRKQTIEHSIVGIGLNINQQHFEVQKATSLRNITQKSYILADLLPILFQHIEKNYLLLKAEKYEKIKENYLKSLYLYQQTAYYYDKKQDIYFEGIIQDVAESGKIIVQVGQSFVPFDLKEIVFL